MYVDLVMCRHGEYGQNYLFVAPRFCLLEKGDEVVVDTKRGLSRAIVIDRLTVDYNGDEYRFIVEGMKATEPLRKVVAKVNYKEFEYTEESDNGVNNDNE